jgi:hypothetical protein
MRNSSKLQLCYTKRFKDFLASVQFMLKLSISIKVNISEIETLKNQAYKKSERSDRNA